MIHLRCTTLKKHVKYIQDNTISCNAGFLSTHQIKRLMPNRKCLPFQKQSHEQASSIWNRKFLALNQDIQNKPRKSRTIVGNVCRIRGAAPWIGAESVMFLFGAPVAVALALNGLVVAPIYVVAVSCTVTNTVPCCCTSGIAEEAKAVVELSPTPASCPGSGAKQKFEL